jgi:hypothetical protein
MKKLCCFSILVLAFTLSAFSQNGPLTESGKKVQKSFELLNFNKVELLDLDGKLSINVGDSFAVTATIDDNLEPLLAVAVVDGTLSVKLKGNYNNKMYVENSNINIQISLPKLTSVYHRSNATLTINNLKNESFYLKNLGNGSTFLTGQVDELTILCRDNGSVYAENVTVKNIQAKRSGNGNIYINNKQAIQAESIGNGDIVVENKIDTLTQSTEKKANAIFTIQNLTQKTVYLKVQFPIKGSYGIDIKPNEMVQEHFPLRTKIYNRHGWGLCKKPICVVTEKNTFIIQ